jgi:hypothetical protein
VGAGGEAADLAGGRVATRRLGCGVAGACGTGLVRGGMATPAGRAVGPELVRLLDAGPPARGAAALVGARPTVGTGTTALLRGARSEAGPVGRHAAVADEVRPVGRRAAVADEAGPVAAGLLMPGGTARGRHLSARQRSARQRSARQRSARQRSARQRSAR